MTDHKELTKNSYDFAIIGSQLHASLIAYTLSRWFQKRVAILEPTDSMGAEDALVTVGTQRVMSHFQRLPNYSVARDLLGWLHQILQVECPQQILEVTPLSIESGKLVPFVGFGDKKFSTLDLLKPYVQGEGYELPQMPSEWINLIKDLFIGDIYTLTEVTSLQIENGRLQYVVVNGSKNVYADQFIYCLPPKNLKKLLSPSLLASRGMQKVLKNKTFSCMRLHLLHTSFENQGIEDKPYHILFGGKEDFEPIVGQFLELANQWHSLWSCWIPSELADDHEYLGSVLRHIKKQVKRAYPQLFDHIEYEKIVVEIDSEGSTSLADIMRQNFCKIEGLWVCHPQLIENTGLIAKLEVAKQLCDALQNRWGLKHVEYTLSSPQSESKDEVTANPI